MRPPPPRSATDAVPGSVFKGLHPGGYASAAPPRMPAIFQPVGGGAGCSHANGPEGRRWLDRPAPARPAISTTAARATATRPRVPRPPLLSLDGAVAVTWSAVVVGVAVTAAVLWNAV